MSSLEARLSATSVSESSCECSYVKYDIHVRSLGSSATAKSPSKVAPSYLQSKSKPATVMGEREQTMDAAGTFLKLPGELRSRIYQFAILTKRALRVEYNGLAEPALLLVSRQVRAESVPIYYLENRFVVRTLNYNFAAVKKWGKRLRKLTEVYGIRPRHEYEFGRTADTPDWESFMEWLKLYHIKNSRFEGPDGRHVGQRPTPVMKVVLDTMLDIVSEMADQPWERVERLLKSHRKILISLDSRWE